MTPGSEPEHFVCLLRGVNVGGRNRVKMAELRSALAEQGLQQVQTYIQSGNVVFRAGGDAVALAEQIQATVSARFGFEPRAMVIPRRALDAAIAACPWPQQAEAEPRQVHLGLLGASPGAEAIEALAALPSGSDAWHLEPSVLYLHTPDGLGRSRLADALERTLRVPITLRNWRSALAIQRLAHADGA